MAWHQGASGSMGDSRMTDGWRMGGYLTGGRWTVSGLMKSRLSRAPWGFHVFVLLRSTVSRGLMRSEFVREGEVSGSSATWLGPIGSEGWGWIRVGVSQSPSISDAMSERAVKSGSSIVTSLMLAVQ